MVRLPRSHPQGRLRVHWIAMALLIALPLGLAACTAPSIPRSQQFTATLGPSDLLTRYHYDLYKYCTSACFTSGRELSSLPGTVLVGADNSFDRGADPFPSIVKYDYAYRAGVRFDLSEFRSFAGIIVEKATLTWTIDHAIVRNGDGGPAGVASGADVTNCVGALMEGKQSPFTAGAFLPGIPYRSGKGDVTSIVQSWIVNGEPNWGFVLVGLDESYSRNNAACLNTLSHFKLTFVYTRT